MQEQDGSSNCMWWKGSGCSGRHRKSGSGKCTFPNLLQKIRHIQLLLPSCSCIFYQFAQGFYLCICCTCYHMKFLFLNDIFYFLELWEYEVRNNSYGIFLPQHLFYYTCYAQKKQFTPFRANCFFLFLFTVQPCYSQADLRLTGSFLR